MRKNTRREGTLQRLLNMAEDQLWTDFNKAAELNQSGDMGTAREISLDSFLRGQLPSRYLVSRGEAVDYRGRQTGQIDIMIYDGATKSPLMTLDKGSGVLLPAEALLATIEVKTTLNGDEITNAIRGIKATQALRPWGKVWSKPRRDGHSAEDELPRIFTTIFAYKTNLSAEDWDSKEFKRLHDGATGQKLPLDRIDRVAVLNHGLILPGEQRVARPSQKGVLALWFFHLVNFLDREVTRRKALPWTRYAARDTKIWHKIEPKP